MVKTGMKSKLTRPQPKAALSPVNQVVGGASHAMTPLFGVYAAPEKDKALRGDPFLPLANVQYISKNDYTTFVVTGGQCIALSKYSDASSSDSAMRIAWVPPMILKQPDKGQEIGPTVGDQRGVFADIGNTKVSFKNVTKQPLRIVINSPRGRISDPATCYLRRFKREIEIQPGRTKWFTATWGDKANIFTPLTATVGVKGDGASDAKSQLFIVADLAVIVNDVDEMSGKKLSDLGDQSFVEVKVVQRYIATASYKGVGGVTFEQRDPFVILKIKKLEEMMIESPIKIVDSLRMVALTGVHSAGMTRLCHGAEVYKVDQAYEGRMLVLVGVGGYFKVVNGCLVHWNPVLDRPMDNVDEPIHVAPGCRFEVLPAQLEVKITDVIDWLTTVTKVLMVVSSLV